MWLCVVLLLKRSLSVALSIYDLVYSQSGTLYDLIPQVPRPSIDPAKPLAEVPIDKNTGSIQSPSVTKPTNQTNASTTAPSTPTVSVEVNSIQSS